MILVEEKVVPDHVLNLTQSFSETRDLTEEICKPLNKEDYTIQPIDFVSPPKWHLAHTTWFFEQFVLMPYCEGYSEFDEDFSYYFNSYYNHAGDRILRAERGMLTRPEIEEVYDYRRYVTQCMVEFMEGKLSAEVIEVIKTGINHEQQHQELLIYDIKYILGNQPSFSKVDLSFTPEKVDTEQRWIGMNEGIYQIGYTDDGFHFDNEKGVHRVFLEPYQISNRLVTNGEYLEFINDGGYKKFDFWHSDGWQWIKDNNVTCPMYWHHVEGNWFSYQSNGLKTIDLDLPVQHISYYEAFAFAQWKGHRLPTEFEWEAANNRFSWGDLWEWTGSAYLPYPGYKKVDGALGEYNGKFMVNQHVMRGGSVATSPGHSRPTYRNFFHPNMRWMFSGIRLVK